jgi:hypothetical protein
VSGPRTTAEWARADWERRIGRRAEEAAGHVRLPAPRGLRADPGRGQVTLTWELVEGAAGYLVHRAPSRNGPFEPVDQLGRDMLAVPHPPYADTSGTPGEWAWYAVAAVPGVSAVGELSEPVAAASRAGGAAAVRVRVDTAAVTRRLPRPWRPMIGSEHLSYLLCLEGLADAACELRHLRVDTTHSNIAATWEAIGGGADWPDDAGWQALRGADRLEALHPPTEVTPRDGVLETGFDLPLPSVSLLELVPRR